MEQPVVGHPVHLCLLLVVLVPHLGLHMAACEQEQVVHIINCLVCLLQTRRGTDKDRWMDTQTDGCTDGQADGWTDRQTENRQDRQTDRVEKEAGGQ